MSLLPLLVAEIAWIYGYRVAGIRPLPYAVETGGDKPTKSKVRVTAMIGGLELEIR
jgi:hypothetical protein